MKLAPDAGPKYVEFVVYGYPDHVRQVIAATLHGTNFTTTWIDPWSVVVERGNEAANVLVGGLAQYYRFQIAIRAAPDPTYLVVRCDRSSAAWVGGLIGVSRTKKTAENFRDRIRDAFEAAGLLVSQSEG
jgi:hypothetical protein